MVATALVTASVAVGIPVTAAVGALTMSVVQGAVAHATTAVSAAEREHLAQAMTVAVDTAGVSGDHTSSAAQTSSTSGSALGLSVTIPERSATACPTDVTGITGSAPAITAGDGAISGTTSDDLAQFAVHFNAIRVANCLEPVPTANFVYDSCMETRLVWMAEDPSTDPASAWGHEGSVRSDGLASVGCDGNLAGGSDNTSETVAQKWWDSPAHRASLFRPDITSGTSDVCVHFAMTHGGVPNEPYSFTRASARWTSC